jgi:hypothetical protein
MNAGDSMELRHAATDLGGARKLAVMLPMLATKPLIQI